MGFKLADYDGFAAGCWGNKELVAGGDYVKLNMNANAHLVVHDGGPCSESFPADHSAIPKESTS
jgi:hypothetical protein